MNLKGEGDEKINDLNNNYFHPLYLYKEISGEPSWDTEGDGLVYVESGCFLPSFDFAF